MQSYTTLANREQVLQGELALSGEMKGKGEKERQKMQGPTQQQHTTLTVVVAEYIPQKMILGGVIPSLG